MGNKMELLAPAGSVEGLKAVIAAGADAVYIGGSRFGARAYAQNPEEAELVGAIDYAHLRNVKVYLTVNTLLKEREMDDLVPYVRPYVEAGVDAVLVQDFGVLRRLHRSFPSLPLHASTQMNVTGAAAARMLAGYGVTRVVPARELSLPEIRQIREAGPEVEVFVHGALCVCYSGQCLYSSMIGGRSGNRGRCAQPCRLLYLKDDERFTGRTSILEEKQARHFLSPKDLCAVDLLPELAGAGVDSLKIEGRMKQPEYAAGVVSVYRKYLDLLERNPSDYRVAQEDRSFLYDLYNRSGFTDGYLHRHNGPEMMALVKHELTSEETERRHALYAEMHRCFMDREKKVPIRIEAAVFAGRPAEASFTAGGRTVRVTGDPVSAAKSQPLDEAKIRANMSKTGETDFEAVSVRVRTDGCSFLPVKSLNELRRAGVGALRDALTAEWRRLPGTEAEENARQPAEETGNGETAPSEAVQTAFPAAFSAPGGLPELSVLVSTEEQLEAAMESAADQVLVESSLLLSKTDPASAAERISSALKRKRKTFGVALPFVSRDTPADRKLKNLAVRLPGTGCGTLLTRSPEMLARLREAGLTSLVRADAGLYTFNRDAEAFLEDTGVTRLTAPLELNRYELAERDNRSSELILYGRIPLMITAQCLVKETVGCTGRSERHTLTDRTGAKFLVGCDCIFCYNEVLNSVPLMLFDEMKTIQSLGFPGVRVQCTVETGAETRRLLEMARCALRGAEIRFGGRFTRGHFLRGVE